mmetsp:Transcript_2507/g.7929  ORF Transcript_2507/g.7929 Transcript_2507/m.7929 type:complete len:215 (+) Transcript_2507:621-1265(+)
MNLGEIVLDHSAILELDIMSTLLSTADRVAAEAGRPLTIAVEVVRVVRAKKLPAGNGRMVAALLGENASSVGPGGLVGFTQNRVEGLLRVASVAQARDCKGNHILHAFDGISGFCSTSQKNGAIHPRIRKTFQIGTRFEQLNRERDRSEVTSLCDGLTELTEQFPNDTLLLLDQLGCHHGHVASSLHRLRHAVKNFALFISCERHGVKKKKKKR